MQLRNFEILHSGLPPQHPGLGLEERRPGRLSERDQVRHAGSVRPRTGILHSRW